jgi:hypothetical protein
MIFEISKIEQAMQLANDYYSIPKIIKGKIATNKFAEYYPTENDETLVYVPISTSMLNQDGLNYIPESAVNLSKEILTFDEMVDKGYINSMADIG